jgi:hypothetical protein
MGEEGRLRTRYAYECVLERASWKAPVQVSKEAEGVHILVLTPSRTPYCFYNTPVAKHATVFINISCLISYVPTITHTYTIKGTNISIHTDNKNVDTIIGIGSRKHTLQDINIEIHNTCEENNVHLSLQYSSCQTCNCFHQYILPH